MAPLERYTPREVGRILGVTEKQLTYWARLGFVRPRLKRRGKFYSFADLISMRAVKQLTDQRVPAQRLRRAVEALRALSDVESPLTELRLLANGRKVVVEHHGARLEPLSGQLLLNFETPPEADNVRAMPERDAEAWFARALDLEWREDGRDEAIEAYREALARRPEWIEARLNLGTLLYEQGALAEAVAEFRCAVEAAPESSLARFNLASALDELGETPKALEHLREAVRSSPSFADAHYNLALFADKLGRTAEARRHWRRYLELAPASPWATYARSRLGPTRRTP